MHSSSGSTFHPYSLVVAIGGRLWSWQDCIFI
nr:MAG TPA: hypothetical protein [Caudoviricetes sp.]